jgi:hypothetical protein
MGMAVSRLLQRFLQWFFIVGLVALVLICFAVAGCAMTENERRWRQADERYARCSKALSANPNLDYQKCVAPAGPGSAGWMTP